jgi:hypothetical protein
MRGVFIVERRDREREREEITNFNNGATKSTKRTDRAIPLRIRRGTGPTGRLEKGRNLTTHTSTAHSECLCVS